MTKRTFAVALSVLLAMCFVGVWFWLSAPRRAALNRVAELEGNYEEDDSGDGRTLAIVAMINRPVSNNDLLVLRNIRPLHRVMLDGSPVTDDGLAHLEGIEGLEWVSLCMTDVTDAGIAHLRRIPGLRSVHLRKTKITDAGIAHLQGMPNLEFVNVAESRVTEAGVAELRRTTPSLKDVYHIIDHD